MTTAKEMVTKRIDVEINKIALNPDNPRLAAAKFDDNEGELNQDEVHVYLKADAGDQQAALKASVLTVGRITEPIHIQKMQSPKDGYEYVVLEGNNRLKVYKDLHKDHSEKDYTGKWERIPCEVYENYDPDVYHEIQLTSHVITKKPWEPYARGEYLYKLQMSGKTLDQLAAICGGTRRKKDIQLEKMHTPTCNNGVAENQMELNKYITQASSKNFISINLNETHTMIWACHRTYSWS